MKLLRYLPAAFLTVLALPLFAAAALPEAKPSRQILSGLSQPATSQALITQAVDFDALSVTDPLYREGSLRLLEQEVKNDAEMKKAPADMRDAPVSRKRTGAAPAPGKDVRLKKTRVKKPVHADPLKEKKAL